MAEHLTADQEVPSSTLGAPLQQYPSNGALGWGFVKGELANWRD